MSTPKLKTVVENGYKTTIVKALISNLYPVEFNYDSMGVTTMSVTDGRLFDAILTEDFVGTNTISVVDGALDEVGSIPLAPEYVGANTITVVTGSLVAVVSEFSTVESAWVQSLSVTAGALNTVVITTTAPQEYVGPNNISVTAGTLT